MAKDKIDTPLNQELLWEYTNWLTNKGYMDSDAICEEPYAVDEFLKSKRK